MTDKPTDDSTIPFRIAAAQYDIHFGDVETNLRAIEGQLASAAALQANLLVLPECATTGYCFESRDEAMPFASTIPGPLTDRLAAAAQHHGMHLVVGMLERDGDRLYNAQAIIGPQGLVGSYRKIHLPQLGVDRFVDPGDQPLRVWNVGQARVGLAICYDSSFPETSRVLALQGADVIALSTNWPWTAIATALLVPPCRSMENHLYFVAANRVGSERGFRFCGRSSICGMDGIELARSKDDQPELLFASVDLAKARSKRIERTVGAHVIDRFGDRRPDFYQLVSAAKPPYFPPQASQANPAR
jgi:5-aminopentanamidase